MAIDRTGAVELGFGLKDSGCRGRSRPTCIRPRVCDSVGVPAYLQCNASSCFWKQLPQLCERLILQLLLRTRLLLSLKVSREEPCGSGNTESPLLSVCPPTLLSVSAAFKVKVRVTVRVRVTARVRLGCESPGAREGRTIKSITVSMSRLVGFGLTGFGVGLGPFRSQFWARVWVRGVRVGRESRLTTELPANTNRCW